MSKTKLKRCTKKQRLCIWDSKDYCYTRSHMGYVCTRRKRHRGNHVACFGNPDDSNSTTHNLAVWRDDK